MPWPWSSRFCSHLSTDAAHVAAFVLCLRATLLQLAVTRQNANADDTLHALQMTLTMGTVAASTMGGAAATMGMKTANATTMAAPLQLLLQLPEVAAHQQLQQPLQADRI